MAVRSFDGSTGYLDLGDVKAFDGALGMTVCAWCYYANGSSATSSAASRGRAGINGWAWSPLDSGHNMTFTKNGVVDIVSSTPSLPFQKWGFCAAVVKATVVRFVHIDGSVLTAQDISNSQAFLSGSTEGRIGGALNGSGVGTQFWPGHLGHLAVWVGAELTDQMLYAFAYTGRDPAPRARSVILPLRGPHGVEVDLRGVVRGVPKGTSLPSFRGWDPPMLPDPVPILGSKL